MSKETLLDAETTNTSSPAKYVQGFQATVFAWGTWDGATVTFEVSPDEVTWFPLTDATFTANGTINIAVPSTVRIRATSSAVGTSSLNAIVVDEH